MRMCSRITGVSLLRHDAACLHQLVGKDKESHFGSCLMKHVRGKAARIGEHVLQCVGEPLPVAIARVEHVVDVNARKAGH